MKKSAGTRIGFVLAVFTISLIVSLVIPIEVQTVLVQENGPVEIFTVALYLAALGYILLKGVYQPLKWIFWLTVLLMLRELDFDSRFTDAKITKASFLLSADTPVLHKLYAFTLLAVVGLVVVKVIITYSAGFWRELRAGSNIALSVLLAVIAAGMAKLVDGGRRKLGYIGLEPSEHQIRGLQVFEELLELSIPLLIMVAISFFLQRYRRGEWQ